MAYSLQFHPELVSAYIRDQAALSRTGRVRLFAALHEDLAVHADTYRQDESRRIAGTTCFWYIVALRDADGDGQIHAFWFAVDDSSVPYGILRLEYVEERLWG